MESPKVSKILPICGTNSRRVMAKPLCGAMMVLASRAVGSGLVPKEK